MHAILLFILSAIIFVGGAVVAVGEGMADSHADPRLENAALATGAAGFVGVIASIIWGIVLIVQAL
jgi:hypothetical protein